MSGDSKSLPMVAAAGSGSGIRSQVKPHEYNSSSHVCAPGLMCKTSRVHNIRGNS